MNGIETTRLLKEKEETRAIPVVMVTALREVDGAFVHGCHGPGGAKPAPESHAAFTPDMCSTCHKATETAAAPGAA